MGDCDLKWTEVGDAQSSILSFLRESSHESLTAEDTPGVGSHEMFGKQSALEGQFRTCQLSTVQTSPWVASSVTSEAENPVKFCA